MTDTTWFEDARFGMFIHFGLYSIPGGIWKGCRAKRSYSEWIQASEAIPRAEYRKLAAQFNPELFDAEEWIAAAKAAGMKYFLITAKHHDGFALWPTQVSDYNVMDATPFKRDILAELSEACLKYGLKLGFYYSHWQDWDGTGGYVDDTLVNGRNYVQTTEEAFENYWQNKSLAQVGELLDNYNPDFLWFDSWGEKTGDFITDQRQDELISLIRRKRPQCLVNSRIRFDAPSDKVDYLSMMDNCFPEESFNKPWETSGTLNHSWAYHKLDFDWKSTRSLLKYLINNASFGGNYQLNVGPTDAGEFQPAAIKRLNEVGQWLYVNGEAIYGTSASDLERQTWGRVTKKADAYYLHLYEFTPDTAIRVKGLKAMPTSATVLETGQELEVVSKNGCLWVEIPKELRGIDLPVVKLSF